MTDRVAGGLSPRHPASAALGAEDSPEPRLAAAPRRGRWPHRLVALALILAGAGVTAYPVTETLVTNQGLTRDAVAYSDAVLSTDPAPRAEQLVRAQQYNQQLTPQILLDPWGDLVQNPTAAHDDYLAQLDTFDAMARLRVPRIKVDLPVFHDATKPQLAKGVGHMYGTALPVGGEGTNSVLAAHTGMRSATMFDRLDKLQAGDPFFIDVYGETLVYRVDRISIVEPDDVRAVAPVPGADYVTLLTCKHYPDNHTRRLLVRGVRVPNPAPASAAAPSAPEATVLADVAIQEWMPLRIAGAAGALALAALMLVAWLVGDWRRGYGRRAPRRVTGAESEGVSSSR